MKKSLSVLLAVVMLLSVIAVPVATADDNEISFAVTTDVHSRDEKQLYVNYPENSLYFHARNSGNLYQESYGILKTMLSQAEQANLDFILIAGDTADSGTKEQHLAIVDILTKFENSTEIPVYIVPGNHDYKSNTTADEIKEYYKDFGYGEALTVDTETASYTADLPGNYRLIAVDSNKPGSDGDGITDRLLSWIETQALQASKDGKTVLYMMHHALLDPIPYASLLMKDFIIRNHEDVAEKFTQWGIRYTFTGHEHGNNITSFTGKNGKKVYDILTTALTSYPLEYRQITCSDGNMNINNIPITVCNSEMLVDGYTEEQLQLMNEDYTRYSYEYFKYSIEKKISNYIEPDFLKDKLNAEDGILADAIDAVMGLVVEALNMPLYKKDTDGKSVEYYANKTGVSLPETDYKTLFDLATTLVSAVYYGNENLAVEDCPEGRLLAIGLNTMLKYILAEAGNAAVGLVLNAVSSDLNNADKCSIFFWNRIRLICAENIYASTITVLTPLLDEFLVDNDIPDRDCVIPLEEETVTANSFADLLNRFKKFIELMFRVFTSFFSVKAC